MSPRPRSVSDQEIFAAVAGVVSRVGPGQLTIAAVAAEAGLAASSLVERFGSRRALLLAFARAGAAELDAVFERARARGRPPLPTLAAALTAMAEAVRSREAIANHLALLQMDLTDPEFREHAVAHGRAFRAAVGRLCVEAEARGDLPPGNAGRRARAVQIVFNGALMTWAIHGEGTVRSAVAQVVPIALGVP